MKLPARLTIYSTAYALDGGTTYLYATDERENEHAVRLVQHARPDPAPSPDLLPGRLYFDGTLVLVRSEVEAGVLALLKAAGVRPGDVATHLGLPVRLSPELEANIRALTARVIAFVESADYLRFWRPDER